MRISLLLLTLFTATIQSILAKEYFVRAKKSSPMLYSLASVVFALIFFVISGIAQSTLDFKNILVFLPYSLGFAAAYGLAIYGSKTAVKLGPLALGTLFSSCYILIPTILGILVLGDPKPPVQRLVGLGALAVSIVVANVKKEDARINLKWIILVLMSIIGNGMCSFTQAAHVKFNGSEYGDEFMIVALLTVAICMVPMSTIGRRELLPQLFDRNLWIFGSLAGLANGFTNMMVMLLVAMDVPQSVIQPTVSAGGLVLTVALAVLLYKEKQSPLKLLSFFLGVVSLILLNV